MYIVYNYFMLNFVITITMATTVTATPSPALVCARWGVMTTIFEPTLAVKQLLRVPVELRIPVHHNVSALQRWCLVVVGDRKSPEEAWRQLESSHKIRGQLVYLSPDAQVGMGLSTISFLPWNHFSRKTVGYLYAIQHGAEWIYDFDDDNEFIGREQLGWFNSLAWDTRNQSGRAFPTITLARTGLHLYNPYPHFRPLDKNGNPQFAWPRGFPLEFIKDNRTFRQSGNTHGSSNLPSIEPSQLVVIQSLANNDPDVDAIYRLVNHLPLTFKLKHSLVAVPANIYSPWNAQAVLVNRKAFWCLLLPASVHGRVSDIWRSYFCDRLLNELGLHMSFASPWVVQHRNPHSYLKDLIHEEPLYEQAGDLISALAGWTRGQGETLSAAYVRLISDMYVRGFLNNESDVSMTKAWVSDLEKLGYEWPAVTIQQPSFIPEAAKIVDGRRDREITEGTVCFYIRCTAGISSTITELEMILLPSLEMFAPKGSEVAVVLNWGESDKNAKLQLEERWAPRFQHLGIHFRAYMEPMPSMYDRFPAVFMQRSKGYDLVQWSNFYADNYTSLPVIAVMDTDSALRRPFIPAEFWKSKSNILRTSGAIGHSRYPRGTRVALGDVREFGQMDFFPILLRRDTYSLARQMIAKHNNKTFDEAMLDVLNGSASQFDILGAVAANFQKSHYDMFSYDRSMFSGNRWNSGILNLHFVMTESWCHLAPGALLNSRFCKAFQSLAFTNLWRLYAQYNNETRLNDDQSAKLRSLKTAVRSASNVFPSSVWTQEPHEKRCFPPTVCRFLNTVLGSSWQLVDSNGVESSLVFQNLHLYNHHHNCSVPAALTTSKAKIQTICRLVLTSEFQTYGNEGFMLLRCQSGATELPGPAENIQFAADLEMWILPVHNGMPALVHRPSANQTVKNIKLTKMMDLDNLKCYL